MKTSLKAGFAQIFSCCPKNLSCPKFGGAAAPLAPPARTPMQGPVHVTIFLTLTCVAVRSLQNKNKCFGASWVVLPTVYSCFF